MKKTIILLAVSLICALFSAPAFGLEKPQGTERARWLYGFSAGGHARSADSRWCGAGAGEGAPSRRPAPWVRRLRPRVQRLPLAPERGARLPGSALLVPLLSAFHPLYVLA